MRLFEITTRDDVVEDHRDAERTELNGLIGPVLELEAQHEPAIV